MRFIHTADLHLDSPFRNLRNDRMPDSLWQLVHQSIGQSFQRIVQDAVRQKVDLVLIVGDLFDRETRSVRAQAFLKKELSRLNRHQIPVLISFGNHDYYSGDYSNLHYPPNTYVFPPQVTNKVLTLGDGKRVGVTGFSYSSRWQPQRMIKLFPVKKGDVDYQIGMIHGQISSGVANYTPFSLGELREKHYDYWALGHVHHRQQLSSRPQIWYCGNIQGRNPNESGAKGYLLVDSNKCFRPKFKATSSIIWQSLTVPVKVVKDEAALVDTVMAFLERQHFRRLHLVRLILRFPHAHDQLLHSIKSGNLLDQIQAQLVHRYSRIKVWVYDVHLDLVSVFRKAVDFDQPYWRAGAKRTFTLSHEVTLAKKLFRQPFINRHFNNRRALVQIHRRARQLIQNCGSVKRGD